MDSQNRVQWVYSSRNNEELAQRYDEWAKDYDADLADDVEWVGPQKACEVFANYVSREARILDAGAGTGLVGHILCQDNYSNIVAMDLSAGMLEEARKKGAYQEFHQMVMGQPLGFETDSFDAVVSVGVLTVGHAPPDSLDELIRVTKPGGHVVFSLRPDVYEEAGFREKQAELEQSGQWKLVECTEPFQVLPKGEPEVLHQVWVYQVC